MSHIESPSTDSILQVEVVEECAEAAIMVSEGSSEVVVAEVTEPTGKPSGCSYCGGGEGMCYYYYEALIMPTSSSLGGALEVCLCSYNKIYQALAKIFLEVWERKMELHQS